jgi:hypothetical protein
MLNNLFFTTLFFILDHFVIMLLFSVISSIGMKYAYNRWHDTSLSPDMRYISLIILILLAVMVIVLLITVIYVVSIFVLYFHEIGKFTGKW